MLEHLIAEDYTPEVEDEVGENLQLSNAASAEVLDAQSKTADWLSALGDKPKEEVANHLEKSQARETFHAITTSTDAEQAKQKLLQLQTPPAVRHLVGMLTAYDWEFIQQTKELRGYAVAKILEECESPNANIRLKALGLLGKVTEVGLFTEKIEVKKTDLTEDEIDRKLKEKLAKFMDVTDADITDVTLREEDERAAE